MSETILNALMQLFAIVATIDGNKISANARHIVLSYLKKHLSQKLLQEYIKIFEDYFAFYSPKTDNSNKINKKGAANSVKVLSICQTINHSLHRKEKFIVLLRLLEFVQDDNTISSRELDFLNTVAETFSVSNEEFNDMKSFIFQEEEENITKENLLVIDNNFTLDEANDGVWFQQNRPEDFQQSKHICNENLAGRILVLLIRSIDTFVVRYIGTETIYLQGHSIRQNSFYVFDHGSIIKGPRITPIYYTDIAAKFLKTENKTSIIFTAQNVSFHFPNSKNGVHPFSISEESGQLIGIMGGSGVGKSTFLNVLNGTLKPKTGKILINGFDIHNDKEKLEGVIGFVPQDDLLIDELTVYQNLYYNAKLCFSNYSETQIKTTVTKILQDLDLFEIKHLTVGNPLNKFISGGQRKRLNIGLELLREPSLLFVDEPTSGLSSMDSETVMLLLKEQTLKGRLVVVNIHQPSSAIYKLFDKLLIIDKGGRLIYNGNPIDAVTYFKRASLHVNAEESECAACGNVNPEQILEIVESKVVDEYGRFTHERKFPAEEWYTLYKEKIETDIEILEANERLPQNNFKIPDELRQFEIFSIRNVLSKLTNRQYMLINLLEAPLLASILAYVTKFITNGTYIFSENKNFPIYLFMSIVVSLFIGLTVSAEEIIKDRRILQREAFLNLSRTSYINSKVFILFIMSAIQTISYVLVGNLILGVQGMTFYHWFILFSTACFSNMVGLNISAALNSVITIYILIPFILVPQLLLGGAMVSYDDLHDNLCNKKYVPFVGDLMTSRWAYEALAVTQFKNNKYEKLLFDYEKQISRKNYTASYLIPEIKNRISQAEANLTNHKKTEQTTHLLEIARTEIIALAEKYPNIRFHKTDSITAPLLTNTVVKTTMEYLDSVANYAKMEQTNFTVSRDSFINSFTKQYGEDYLLHLKQENHNKSLTDFVTGKMTMQKIIEYNGELVAKKDPVYMISDSPYGRSHFYAAEKNFFGKTVDTYWFNSAIIWLTTFFCYLCLLGNVLKKIMEFPSKIKTTIFKKNR